ncbi:MAG TPA: FmdB family zinc ribbon protein [Burkholderiales bacterium]|nr:FmdB family zinc ribbon protein [Burkholderiales bacterium]
MPIYEYRCSSCGFQKEYLRKLNDPVLTVCPECSKQTFSKMLTAAGFQLKGSGWYATDFRNSGAKPAAKSGAKDAGDAKSDAKPEAKSDTKSDTKSDPKPDAKSDKPSGDKSESKSEAKAETVSSGAGVRP